jgi:ferredoxin
MTVRLVIRRKGEKSQFEVRRGLGLQAVCAKAETGIEFDCRAADCGICVIKVTSGAESLSPKTTSEADFLKAMNADEDERLACQVRVFGDVEIETDYL